MTQKYPLQIKQKTAYEIRLSLVGSEMCIRDRDITCLAGTVAGLFVHLYLI